MLVRWTRFLLYDTPRPHYLHAGLSAQTRLTRVTLAEDHSTVQRRFLKVRALFLSPPPGVGGSDREDPGPWSSYFAPKFQEHYDWYILSPQIVQIFTSI